MKQVFRLSVVTFALILVSCVSSLAQTASVDPFITQLTSSPTDSLANDISGNGRFVVVVSSGDIATEKIPSKKSDGTANPNARNNEDGNREIFLVDYAQRRSFQITNTRHALKDPNGSTTDRNNIQVEIVNNRPVISNDGHWIAFSSNATLSGTALNPGDFNGNTHSAALASDANTEIFLYQIPPYADVNLSSGVDVPLVTLSGGTFIRATDTPASVRPRPGSTTSPPIIADDNRDASINDNGSFTAFVSTRDLVAGQNAEVPATPEIFIFNRATRGYSQVTHTEGFFTSNENPTISGAPPPANVIVSFISNGNITGNNEDLNSEVHYAIFNGSATTGITQVTRTTRSSTTPIVNVLSPGRRLSRNGNLIAFESTANLTTDGAIQSTFTVFVFDIAANRFIQVGARSAPGTDVTFRFPTFTGDSSTVVFTSSLNFNTDGTTTTTGGLNPSNLVQIFSSPVPAAPSTTISLTRLTHMPAGAQTGKPGLQTYVSNTRERIAFTTPSSEFGSGNPDRLNEAFYLLARPGTAVTATVGYFTGASARPVVAASNPTPPAVTGLAPGMLAIATSNVALAPSNQASTNGSNQRLPPLPIELNGVTMSINGAACGLYFVGNSPSEIRFVVPIGLAPATDPYPVVINNNGSVIRSTIRIVAAQPDIFSTTGSAGGRALIFNVTRSPFEFTEPPGGFPVTSSNGTTTVATILRIVLTGVRGAQPAQLTVRFGSISLTGAAIKSVAQRDMPGFDQVDVQLPASAAGSCNVPVIVTFANGGQTFASRPAESAPVISIGPCP